MTTVTLQTPAGTTIPTDVVLGDGSIVRPDSSGHITVDSRSLPALLANGWQLVVSAAETEAIIAAGGAMP